ncbi:transmembrane protein 134 isoform X2 [Panthera leo]|uniref:transmembrane protein 134 isoform X2 n=1 Tax=Panthera leo TaxID=9689 RepID=UPI001C6A4F3D|nr:transmembrane protein 134 isoform X2 [Panthera leo]
MSAARPQFSIDDAFELSLEDAGPGPEFSGVARFGPLHFERRARFEVADEDKQSRLRYQGFRPNVHPQLPVVLQHHQQQHPAILPCLLQLDATPFDPEEPPGSAGLLPTPAAGAGSLRLSFIFCEMGMIIPVSFSHGDNKAMQVTSLAQCLAAPGHTTEQRKISLQTFPRPCQVPCSENTELALILIAVGLEVAPSPGVSSAIFFVPGFLLLVPGVYHVIFIYCAVKGHRGFQFFYLPYFEK